MMALWMSYQALRALRASVSTSLLSHIENSNGSCQRAPQPAW